MRRRDMVLVAIAAVLMAGLALAQAIPNWTAPSSWTPPKGHMTASAMTDLAGPQPFIPVTPCRVADTRGNGFTGAYGPPALAASGTRSFTIAGQCGIPAGATAVSFNFTVTGLTAAGDLRFYPAGGTLPTVSTINWTPSTGVIANAAVVPLGGGAITVKNDCAATVQLIIDVNGYYTQLINSNEFFGIYGSLDNGGLIYANNGSTAGGTTSAIRGVVSSGGAGSSAILGQYGGSAAGYGVEGTSVQSSNAAGVVGRDQSSTPTPFSSFYYIPAGVRGESANSLGVLGISNYMAGAFENYDASGNEMNLVRLAYGANGAVLAINTGNVAAGAGAVEASSAGPAPAYGVDASISTVSGSGAGVRGVAGSIPSTADSAWNWAGVRGLGTNFGVLGISTSLGVGGFRHDASTGALQSGSYLGYNSTTGLYTLGNTAASGTKSFVDPHPTDPTKEIKFVALEGPEAGTYFRGKGRIVGGQAVITVPESFRMVTDADGLTVQVTPIGRSVSVSVLSYDLNAIVVEADKDTEFFYTVNGVRKGFGDFQPIQKNEEFKPSSPQDTMPTALSALQKRVLVQTGIYNEDGTVNMDNAERLGWAQEWRERDERIKAASEAAAKLTAKAAGQTESGRLP